MRDVAIIGVGRTEFIISDEFSSGMGAMTGFAGLGAEAVKKALKEAKNLEKKDIETVYCGRSNPVTNAGQTIMQKMEMLSEGSFSVDNGVTSGTTALLSAYRDVAAGMRNVALVVGFETMAPGQLYITPDGQGWKNRDSDSPPIPRSLAQLARRHMSEYGTTKEQLAMVTAKNRKNGALNPNALNKEEVSADDVLNSRMVAEPLTEPMCSIPASGATAVVICDEKSASYYTSHPIKIAGFAMTTGKAGLGLLDSAYDPIVRAAREAYRMVGPFFSGKDVDIAQVDDTTAINELIAYEALGFCNKGEAGKMVEDGVTNLDGALPVNTDGGMLANGQPLGACGLAQVYELVEQLRGKAKDRQVKDDIEYAVQYNGGSFGSGFCGGIGGRGFGTGGSYIVNVFTKV
ncbi:MAG: thiolase family protein [Halobacteriota archaeon]|nr:thiolase family protein [Halobacteriota archaeon]